MIDYFFENLCLMFACSFNFCIETSFVDFEEFFSLITFVWNEMDWCLFPALCGWHGSEHQVTNFTYECTNICQNSRKGKAYHSTSHRQPARMLPVWWPYDSERVNFGGNVAQLVEHLTGTPPTQVRFPGAARDFFLLESTFSADSLTVSVHPRVQSHAFTSVRTLKIL